MLLFNLKSIRIIHQLLKDLYLHKSLDRVLLLVLDDLHRVQLVCLQIDAFYDLAECSLAQVLHDLVLSVFW